MLLGDLLFWFGVGPWRLNAIIENGQEEVGLGITFCKRIIRDT